MDSIQDRIPSSEEVQKLFFVCIVPIGAWSVVIFLYELPGYLRRMNLWDALGIFSYSQAIALIESVLILVFLLFVCLALPARFFKKHFIAQGTVIFIWTFVMFIPLQYQSYVLEVKLHFYFLVYYLLEVIWVIAYVSGLLLVSWLLRRYSKFEGLIKDFAARVSTLAGFYIAVGALSFVLILYRNLF